jgi:hypothetical protein
MLTMMKKQQLDVEPLLGVSLKWKKDVDPDHYETQR